MQLDVGQLVLAQVSGLDLLLLPQVPTVLPRIRLANLGRVHVGLRSSPIQRQTEFILLLSQFAIQGS